MGGSIFTVIQRFPALQTAQQFQSILRLLFIPRAESREFLNQIHMRFSHRYGAAFCRQLEAQYSTKAEVCKLAEAIL